MSEFVRQRAALAHGVASAGDGDHRDAAFRVTDSHAVLVGVRGQDGDVDVSRPVDQRNEVFDGG